jgi:signal transduction histidine kinase
VSGKSDPQAVYLQTSILPAVVLAVVSVAGLAYAFAGDHNPGTFRLVIVGVTCCAVLMAIAAIAASSAVGRRLASQLGSVRAQARRGRAELLDFTERVLRGEQAAPPSPVPAPGRVTSGDPFRMLAHELDQAQYAAGQAIMRVAERATPASGRGDQRVEIFVNLARRMQSLVHREIEMLDDLEAQVEDPELLKGLFTVDHLATRMRRQSESLAVLGGSTSRRQWTRQVNMHEVLRAAVAEVEQYSRVKIVPPVEGVLRGSAVADVIHLVAELVENATKFSPPKTSALIRAQHVTAGVAIEIEDRGLGMVNEDLDRMNSLLSGPAHIDLTELLSDGRIGLYVVSTLAHRHGIQVRLQSNIYGGVSAIVVLPRVVLDDGTDREPPRVAVRSAQAQPQPQPQQAIVQPQQATAQSRQEPERQLAQVGVTTTGPQVRRVPGASLQELQNRQNRPAPPASMTMSFRESDAPSFQTQSSGQPGEPSGQPGELFQPAAGRPALPRRQAQATLSAHLGEEAGRRGGPSAMSSGTFSTIPGAAPDEPAEQMPGLMADFLRGVNRSADGDGTGDDSTQPEA